MVGDILFKVEMVGVDAWIAQTSKLVTATNNAFASIKIPDLSLGNQTAFLKEINKSVAELSKSLSGIKMPKIPENSMPSKPFELATASLSELQKELNKTKANFSGGSTAYIEKLSEKIAQFKAEMNGVKAVKLPIPEPRAFNLATANVGELQKELAKLQKQFNGGDAAYIIKVRERLKDLKVEMGAVSKESFTEKLKGAFGGAIREATDFKGMLLGAVTGGAIVAGAAQIGKAIFDVGKFAINSAAQFESLRASLDVITGSTAAGGKLFQQFQTLASTSPFNFDDVAEQGTKLLAMGIPIDDVTNRLSRIGDVAAGVGREKLPSIVYAYGQIKAQGKAMAGDLSQFVNAGVPIFEELAKVIGKPEAEIKKLASAGKIGFKEIDAALINMTSSGGKFFEMMKTQSNTFEGLWSSMEDSFQILGAQLGQALLPLAKEVVITITELINGIVQLTQTEGFKNWVNGVAESFSNLVAGMKYAISAFDFFEKKQSEQTKSGQTAKSESGFSLPSLGSSAKAVLTSQSPILSMSIDVLQSLGVVQKKTQEINDNYKKVEESYTQLERGLGTLTETDLSQLSAEGKAVLDTWGFVGEAVTNTAAKIPPAAEFAAGSIGAITQSLTEAKDRLNKLSAGSGAFAAVAKETIILEKQLKSINERLALMATNSNSLEGLQVRLSQMEAKLRETSASSSTFDKLAQGVVKFKDQIEVLQNRIKAFENVKGSVNDLNFQIQIINNQINKQAPNSGLIPSLVMQSVELANRLKAIQDNIKMLSFAPNTLEALNFQLTLTNEKYNKTTDQTIFNQIAVEALATEKQVYALNKQIEIAKRLAAGAAVPAQPEYNPNEPFIDLANPRNLKEAPALQTDILTLSTQPVEQMSEQLAFWKEYGIELEWVNKNFADMQGFTTALNSPFVALGETMGMTTQKSILFANTMIETFSKIKNEAFQSLGQGLAQTAEMFGKGIGDMIMGVASFEDVLKQALISLGKTILVEIPKVIGMGLIQSAFSPVGIAMFPANIPIALAGLALVGLSGIASGILNGAERRMQDNKTKDIKSANQTLAGGNVGATNNNSPMGLGGINGNEPVINTQMTVIIQNTGIDGIVLNTIQQQAFTQQRIK